MEALTLKALAVLDTLHERMAREGAPDTGEIYDTIGCVIAMLRDGYDPDDNL